MTTRRRKPETKGKDAIEGQRKQVKKPKQTMARKTPVPETIAVYPKIRTREELIQELRTILRNAPAVFIEHFEQDYLQEFFGLPFMLTNLEKAPNQKEKDAAKSALVAYLQKDFKTYRMYWDDLIEKYNDEQEALYRQDKTKKPKWINPANAWQVVCNEDDIAKQLERISFDIKAHYARPDLLDDLSLIKRLIAEARNLVLGQ